ncbi:helix-turn-helix domain-containing protein [Saccharopolyspora pogona]|uniref:helix-turn-helix domain-containing protein n=1 Tax=Saccharopolyspora pogona TaxID=333966 RepID=UPI001CC260F1|nr:helix-turn-helix domain-containing protein [Saccharopolyspora pogona]
MIFMRLAYRCRAYPDSGQLARLGRTFGCVRLVWNKTLAVRHRTYHGEGRRISYKETDAALTQWKKAEVLATLTSTPSATRRNRPGYQLGNLDLITVRPATRMFFAALMSRSCRGHVPLVAGQVASLCGVPRRSTGLVSG